MSISMLLIIFAVSAWFGFIGLAIVLPLRPQTVRLTEKWVCPPGSQMFIETEVYSYHRPGQRAIHIYYTDSNGQQHDAAAKALFLLWGFFFFVSLPLSAVIVYWLASTLPAL